MTEFFKKIILNFYRPQRSWGKIIFSEACVKNSVHRGVLRGGGRCCVAGGMHVCMHGGGVHGRGACVAGGPAWGAYMVGGHMWQKGGRHAWQILRDTVNERVVRILLECILVY